MRPPLIYLIAGEASGDALDAGLMRSLRAAQPGIRFAGIGGEAMQREDLRSLFPCSDLSIMGFLEVVPHIPALLRRLRETALDIVAKQPAVIVTIDSPGFNFRLAQALKARAETARIKRIHYVAPSVWAYKPSRARKTALLFDAVILASPQVRNGIEGAVTSQMLVVDIAEKQDSFAAATIALSKSGTITLEVASAGVPTVVAHKVSALSAWLIRRMALIPSVSLVNIVARKEILPELLQERCTPKRIVAQPDIMLEQRQQCLEALEMLRGPGALSPHDAAAAVVLSYGLENNMGISRPGEE